MNNMVRDARLKLLRDNLKVLRRTEQEMRHLANNIYSEGQREVTNNLFGAADGILDVIAKLECAKARIQVK